MRHASLAAAMFISFAACSSNNSDQTELQPAYFTGSALKQIQDCESVSQLAPNETTVEYIGNIWREEVDSDTDFQLYWNQVTAENAAKWGEVERVRDNMQWDRQDAAVGFAETYNMSYKFHTLVWGGNQPAWLNNLPADQQLIELDQWMNQIAARYPDLQQVDVVNEPLHAPPTYKNALSQLSATTSEWTWVVNTFAKARQIFPNSELLLNDFNILHSDEKTNQYLEIIALLQDNALIDGIGVQAHFLEQASIDKIRSNLNRLGSTGLPIYISEFDLNIADDQQQLDRMRQLFPVFYESAYVKGITFWGFRENQLWQANAHLINADGSKRPAMKWLECYAK